MKCAREWCVIYLYASAIVLKLPIALSKTIMSSPESRYTKPYLAKKAVSTIYSLMISLHHLPSFTPERGRLCYYKKDLAEFQTKRDSFTKPEERVAFVKERKAIVSEMEKV